MVVLQPADWIEKDEQFKYVVDVFGRTDTNEVAHVRLTGFSPYFYLKAEEGETGKFRMRLNPELERRCVV
jgi:hypothetical protein